MLPRIIENHTNVGVNVGRIVHRILSHVSPDILTGLNEVRLLEGHEQAFACYKKDEGAIEIYLDELLGDFPPVFLKLFYPFTYMVVGMALGHELDHHVNRNNNLIDREASAERNIMNYVYPSMGLFKPIVRIFSLGFLPFRRIGSKRIMDQNNG